jgi:SAM-dependent methyltransferase
MSEFERAEGAMNYDRLYRYRHRKVKQGARDAVWREVAPFVHRMMGSPRRVLDPAVGRFEFINAVPAEERWGIDAVLYEGATCDPDVKMLFGDASQIDLPPDYFDGIFVSNLLEHFGTQDEIASFLGRMRDVIVPGGRVVVMGPNFRYCAKRYFDYADHTLALTHVAVDEHLYAAGFEVDRVIPRFLPYSFSGALPASRRLTKAYLRLPPVWRVLGKQFLVLATAEG